ncbi:lysophospholipid acyltransferase family protein [Pseudooceanicola sp. CBS1P-1]|uniref:Lauroyl acyltransferase n=1 Tax=Pseudooceanicola albus TaxID=2692189 RepID=A0A6L7FYD6_9RHOB|nr:MULTISPECIES: lysophospholipid acyltransferase family protein [Pseudooceanicola]MBT9382268.1 lysophospholipid acyltransferase family protein [Pseudooceanicola endophyticus]MXN16811.1 lauroyl acyltransferase [Pseudooceanicola albus]
MDPKDQPLGTRAGHYLSNLAMMAALRGGRLLPYERRVPLVGRLMQLVAPFTGWRGRIRTNLQRSWPQLPEAEIERLVKTVPERFGRTFAEIFTGDEFADRLDATPLTGPGLATLEEAHAAGRPVIFVSGHFGNWDAARSAISRRFAPVGAIYRPLNNPYSERQWRAALKGISEPIFPRSRRGLAEMVRYLRQGNMIAILHDQHFSQGVEGRFFGRRVRTAPSAAEMALKYDALLIPAYGIRQPDGLSFEMRLEAPIPHSDPETMTQAMTDSLEVQVRAHPEQWFWIHRRWKAEDRA